MEAQMNRPSVRIALALVAVAVVALCGYRLAVLERQLDDAAHAAAAVTEHFQAALIELGNVRASQQAYVAAGQGGGFWGVKVDGALEAVRAQLAQLHDSAAAPDAVAAVEAAQAALENFGQMDRRAREQSQNGQLLTASDLIFTDGLEAIGTAARQIDTARRAEQAVAEQRASGTRRAQIYTLAAGVGTALAVLILMVPVKRETAMVEQPVEDRDADSIDLDPPERAAVPPPIEPRLTEGLAPPPLPIATQDAATAPTLSQTAELCSALARVVDAGELPGLLERASRLLGASGVIVWMADRPGSDLRPVLAHGYSASALARMPSIARDSDNATAAAYRDARLEVVRTNGTTNGALVAPLITADGCVGVMAAEVKFGAECKASLQALARILAAQLAALVSSSPAAPEADVPEVPREMSSMS
jgi:hypothetical protein